MKILTTIILDLFITSASVYNVCKLSSRKVKIKSIKFLLCFVSLMLIAVVNYFNVNSFIRITIITLSLVSFYKFLFKASIRDSIITSLISQMIIMVSEMIFVFLISVILKLNSQDIVNSQFGGLFSNISISIVSFIIVQIPILRRIRNSLLDITSKLKNNQVVFLSASMVIIANILTMILYYKIEFKYLLLFNTFLTLFFLIVIIYLFRAKNNYLKVYEKYNITLNSLKEYEDILDKYKISNHENKNQLLTLRSLISKNNKKAISYIDQIVNNKIKDNDRIMLKISVIPSGGLRGLIYSKLLLMNELGIKYDLLFSKEIKTVDLINKLDDIVIFDICKIIGVYLDNSIDAVNNLNEKYIYIEMYLEEKSLVISITNNYSGVIELDKIEDIGYTTKEKGHGYGLVLARQIINNNPALSNERKITENSFTQILKIKM